MSDCMTFPNTVEEFMEQYKMVDTEQIYSNGMEFVPIFRMRQWFEHMPSAEPEQKTGKWIPVSERLPEEETDVLVTRKFLGCKDGSHGWNNHIPPTTYVEVAQYFNGEWIALSDEYKVARSRHTDPIAWMPLPKPYTKGEE